MMMMMMIRMIMMIRMMMMIRMLMMIRMMTMIAGQVEEEEEHFSSWYYGSVAGFDVHDPWSDTCVSGRGSRCSVFFLLEFTGRIDGSKRITADSRLYRKI